MISPEIVEKTWLRIGALGPAEIQRELHYVHEKQPHLLEFVVTQSSELSKEAEELALYLFIVVHQMFDVGAKNKPKPIRSKEISDQIDVTFDLLESLDGCHDRFFERIAGLQTTNQPNVYQYILEAMFEEPENGEEKVNLSEQDAGGLFILLKTAIDALDKKSEFTT